jgi:hypothetical protein
VLSSGWFFLGVKDFFGEDANQLESVEIRDAPSALACGLDQEALFSVGWMDAHGGAVTDRVTDGGP